ncbi:hypothetical protein BDQ17DRAFT_313967 [Cyathus striatus]|nr:hypothetical protein BDQ17DRAFT_313967 [Cyathus striatus]
MQTMLEAWHIDKSPEELLELLQKVRSMNMHLVSSLIFLIWDIMITFDDEVRYIWRLPRFSPTKWIFLITRYIAVFSLCRMCSLNIPLPLSLTPPESSVCVRIYIAQKTCSGVLFICAQALLMTRACALYFCNRKVAISMGVFLILQVPSIPVIIHFLLPKHYAVMCIKITAARDVILFSVVSIVPFLIILGLTITKYVTGLKAGWGQIPIVSLLVKDDIRLVSIFVSWITATAIATNFISPIFGYTGLYWIMSILPASVRIPNSYQKQPHQLPDLKNPILP